MKLTPLAILSLSFPLALVGCSKSSSTPSPQSPQTNIVAIKNMQGDQITELTLTDGVLTSPGGNHAFIPKTKDNQLNTKLQDYNLNTSENIIVEYSGPIPHQPASSTELTFDDGFSLPYSC